MSSITIVSLNPHNLLRPSKLSIPSPSPSSFSSFQWRKILRPPTLLRTFSSKEEDKRFNLDAIFTSAHKLFDDLPQPVKKFPWAKALASFFRLLLDLACEVAKYLSLPILAVSSLSEMSYCGHEKKLALVPFPFLIGFVLAGVFVDTANELAVGLKEGEFPWHLFIVGTFFMLLKLPGPYYPYWGRLIVPHLANGGLWRTIWHVFVWHKEVGRTRVQTSPSGCDDSL